MKTNEIIPGDWIKMNGYPVQLKSINYNYQEKDMEPIPLTKEILINSGWEYVGGCCVLRSAARFGWKPNTKELIIGYTTIPFYVMYVHELQHFLYAFRVQTPIVLP